MTRRDGLRRERVRRRERAPRRAHGRGGTALAAAINLFNPEVIALGGFLAALHAYDPDGLLSAVSASALGPSSDAVRILPAELGADLLMIGAAGLAFRPLLEDPALANG